MMDPNATLEEMLDLADQIEDADNEGRAIYEPDAARLADLVASLHSWLRKGGCLPKAWERDDAGKR